MFYVILGMPQPPLLTVQRYLRGSGHEWGGLYTEITNHHPTDGIKLLYLDMIPWFCRVYMHTLAVNNGIHYQCLCTMYVIHKRKFLSGPFPSALNHHRFNGLYNVFLDITMQMYNQYLGACKSPCNFPLQA